MIADLIRTRDNDRCRICNKRASAKHLDVHHIDHNTENNQSLNLVSLCNTCHKQVHAERYIPSFEDERCPWGQLVCIDSDVVYENLLKNIATYPFKARVPGVSRKQDALNLSVATNQKYNTESKFGEYMNHLIAGGNISFSEFI